MTVNKTFELSLDIKRPTYHDEFSVVNGDNGNLIHIFLMDGETPVDLSGCRVIAAFSRPDGAASMQDSGIEGNGLTLDGENGNEVIIALSPACFSPGVVECELQIYSDNTLSTLITTARFNFVCRPSIINQDTLQASSEFPLLRRVLDEINGATEQLDEIIADAKAAQEACSEESQKLENMTASLEMLSFDQSPTAELTEADGIKHLALGIPALPVSSDGCIRESASAISELILADNHEYYLADIGDITFAFPDTSHWECWASITLSDAETHTVNFPEETLYIGSLPQFEASGVYELSVKNGVAILQKAGDGA